MFFYRLLISIFSWLVTVSFFVIPILTVVFFVRSIYRYVKARKANKKAPGTFSDEVMRERKITLIITSILMGLFVAAIVGVIVLLYGALAYM